MRIEIDYLVDDRVGVDLENLTLDNSIDNTKVNINHGSGMNLFRFKHSSERIARVPCTADQHTSMDMDSNSNTTGTPVSDLSMNGSDGSGGGGSDIADKLYSNLSDLSNRKKHGVKDADGKKQKLEKLGKALQASISVPNDTSPECEACRQALMKGAFRVRYSLPIYIYIYTLCTTAIVLNEIISITFPHPKQKMNITYIQELVFLLLFRRFIDHIYIFIYFAPFFLVLYDTSLYSH